ncbi:MAG: HlyD family efflux transporter periplasmic adaptor subunit [Alteromonadaceae bacterium]|nr:HlyD family efflux transporter periplasmic adaptor subunit [Alteromonadaceae bacterium]
MIQGTQGQDEIVQKQHKKNWRRTLLMALVIIVITSLFMPTLSRWYSGLRLIEREGLLTAKVFGGVFIRDVAVSGKLVAANAPKLYSSEPGKITLLAKPGDMVAKNDIIAVIESPELEALLTQEQSLFERLKIEADRGALIDDEAQLDLERSLDIAQVSLIAEQREKARAEIAFNKHLISEIDFVQRKDALLKAELFHQHALKRVALAKKRLSFESQTRDFSVKRQGLVLAELERRQHELDIRSPVSGIVGNWLVAQKEQVADSQVLMTVVDLSQYEAELNVPEFYADDLGLGLQVNLTLAGKKFIGKIGSISPEVLNNQIRVRVNIPANSGIKMRQNQRLNARIEFEKKDNVLMVKRGAFLKSTAGKSVFVISKDKAQRQTIQTGSASVEYIELISGVNEGDTLIISDYKKFNEEQQILLTY